MQDLFDNTIGRRDTETENNDNPSEEDNSDLKVKLDQCNLSLERMTVKQRREEVSMSMNLEMLKAQLSQEEIAFK